MRCQHQQAIKSLFQVMALAGALLVVIITLAHVIGKPRTGAYQNLNCNRNRADAGSGPGTANQTTKLLAWVIAMEASDASRSSVHLGNAGEHLVMADLLGQGFQAFMADRGNPAFDISVVDGHRHSLIRVKTTSSERVMWSRKPSGVTFLDLRMKGDYCCIVDMRKGVARAEFYLVPRTWFRRPSTNASILGRGN